VVDLTPIVIELDEVSRFRECTAASLLPALAVLSTMATIAIGSVAGVVLRFAGKSVLQNQSHNC